MAMPRLQLSKLCFRSSDDRVQEAPLDVEGREAPGVARSSCSSASSRTSAMGVVRRLMMPFGRPAAAGELALTAVVPDTLDGDSMSSARPRRTVSAKAEPAAAPAQDAAAEPPPDPPGCPDAEAETAAASSGREAPRPGSPPRRLLCSPPSPSPSEGRRVAPSMSLGSLPELPGGDDTAVRRTKSRHRSRVSLTPSLRLQLPGEPAPESQPASGVLTSLESFWSGTTEESLGTSQALWERMSSRRPSSVVALEPMPAIDEPEDGDPLQRLAARGGWHLIRAPLALPAQRSQTSARATVIHLALEEGLRSQRAAAEAMAHAPRGKPIVVLLDTGGAPPPDDQSAEELTMGLVAEGADGVVWRGADDEHTRRAVGLGIAEAMARARMRQREAKSREASARRRAHAGPTMEPRDGMFWLSVHHLFKGFPKLDSTLPQDLSAGCVVGPCELQRVLGQGQFGCVYSSTHSETGALEAVKTLDKGTLTSLRMVRNLWTEMCCLRRLRHPNVVGFVGLLHSPNHIIIRMEHAGSNNLFRELKALGGRLSLPVACGLQAELLAGLEHCHSRNVAHRDIKPENIAICDGHAKVVDFGSAAPADKPTDDLVGTMPLIAPEVLRAQTHCVYMPAAADIWSSAVVFLEMACGANHLSKLVCWPSSPKAEPESAGPLLHFFSEHQRVRSALVESLPDACEGLVEFLLHCFWLDPETRLSSGQASATLQRLLAPRDAESGREVSTDSGPSGET